MERPTMTGKTKTKRPPEVPELVVGPRVGPLWQRQCVRHGPRWWRGLVLLGYCGSTAPQQEGRNISKRCGISEDVSEDVSRPGAAGFLMLEGTTAGRPPQRQKV